MLLVRRRQAGGVAKSRRLDQGIPLSRQSCLGQLLSLFFNRRLCAAFYQGEPPLGFETDAGDLHPLTGAPDLPDGHLPLGQGAGFVSGDDVSRTQGLHRR